ncbi:Gustatory receptor 143 [Halyomorpha halys]|nr:Gustatory receptor 143 [Halyomorpha halys]
MKRRKPNDVFVEVNNFLLVYRAVGLCYLTYSLGEFRLSWKLCAVSFFTLWPFVGYNIYFFHNQWFKSNDLFSYLIEFRLFFLVLSVFITWLSFAIRLRSFNRCLRKIQLVDYYLFSVGEQVPSSEPSKVILSTIVMVTVPTSIWASAYSSYLVWTILFILLYPYILMLMVHLFLDKLCTILFLRYQAVANILRRCLSLQGMNAARLSEKMVFCYENLCSSGECIDYFFSWSILFILASVFLMSFSEVYGIIALFYVDQPFDSKKIKFTTHICMVVITMLTNWRFGYRFSSLADKTSELNSLLYQLMIEDKTNEILYNEKLMLHFTMKREVIFTACGLFKLDYTLVHSMIASATTYLVLLIQFGKLSPD